VAGGPTRPRLRPSALPGCRASLACRVYGLRVGVRANDAVVLTRVRTRLPPGWRSVRGRTVDRLYSLVVPRRRGVHALYGDTTRLVRARSLRDLLESLESDLQLHVAEWAPRRVFIHAGVVGWRGRAILLPGRSLSGKSTLVAALVRAGATYYSDEYAVLDVRGRVHPYARLLSLRAEGTHERRRRSAASLGGRAGVRPLPVALVVVTRYRAGAGWRPRRLSPGAGALELMAHAVAIRRDPARVLAAIQRAVLQARVLRGVRGEAREAARALLDAVSRRRAGGQCDG
jgi:hypothetical protein